MNRTQRRAILILTFFLAGAAFAAWRSNQPPTPLNAGQAEATATDATTAGEPETASGLQTASVPEKPEQTNDSTLVRAGGAPDGPQTLTMAAVLQMAEDARKNMAATLDDYTARFVKQERDAKGVLSEETQLQVKIQTRLRGDTEEAPMRVYLRFDSPKAVKGREVIWAQDLHDGKMAVHENYFPLSLKTIWLDPNGYLAMQGQRYPISEIGLVRLVEKLLERGEVDRNNPEITVTLHTDQKLDETPTELIRVSRAKPSGREDDFSLAEIVIDPKRQLILQYRAFGWPEAEGQEAPLLESYTYHDVKTNVGLSEKDFDPTNSGYAFP